MKQRKCLHSELYQKKTKPGNGRNAQEVQNVTCCRPDSLVQSQNTHSRRTGRKKKPFTTINPTVKRQTRKLFPSEHTKFKYGQLPNICCDYNSENMATANNPPLPQKSTMFSFW